MFCHYSDRDKINFARLVSEGVGSETEQICRTVKVQRATVRRVNKRGAEIIPEIICGRQRPINLLDKSRKKTSGRG